MVNETELLCAVAKQAFADLITAYKKNDPSGIKEGEWFFLSGDSLFDLLEIDGNTIVEVARKRARK